jgi:Cu2+-exporting ATPase
VTAPDAVDHGIHAAHGDHDAAGHDKHAGHSVEMFRQKFWGTLLLSIPTIVWAPMIQHWFGYDAPGGTVASRWIPAIFGTAVFAYGGVVFNKGAIGEIRDRLPGMMTLISLAIGVAFFFSLAVTFGFPGSDLWWELATLVTIMVLGHWIEMRSISQAQGGLKSWPSSCRTRQFESSENERKTSPSRTCGKRTSCSCVLARPFRPTASSETARAT